MRSKIKIWSGILPDRQVVTITHIIDNVDELAEPGCEGCDAPCCSSFAPILSDKEARSGKFELCYISIPERGIGETKSIVPSSALVTTIKKQENGKCVYQDENNRCTIHANRPVTCALYDCRKETRGKMSNFVKERYSK